MYMKKNVFIVIIAFVVIGGIYLFNKNSVPANLEQANVLNNNSQESEGTPVSLGEVPTAKNLSFTFTGYGPAGKFHDGVFNDVTLSTSSVVFKSASVDTGIDGLDKHLCAAEFFDCVTYPEIKFTADSLVQKTETTYEVVGTLTFKDITKQVSFTAVKEGNKVSSDFLLDTTEFNFDPKLVENNVRVRFSFEI